MEWRIASTGGAPQRTDHGEALEAIREN